MHKNNFVNFCITLAFLIALTTEEELKRAQAARALPFPFGRKRKQKGPFRTALRQREADSHKPTRSANLPKLNASRRFKHMERFVFCAAAQNIPSRATQSDSAGAASAFRKLLNAQSAAGNARFLQPFVAWKPLRRSQVTIGQGSIAPNWGRGS